VASWESSLQQNFTAPSEQFNLHSGRTGEETTPILAEYIRGFYGSGNTVPLPFDISIEPNTSLRAMLASSQTWSMYVNISWVFPTINLNSNSHNGVGDGVKRTVITELLEYVCRQGTSFKQLSDEPGGKKYIIQVHPPTVAPPDVERQSTLKAAGFITMLYIMEFQAIPEIFPPAFILAILAGEQPLQDLDFLQALAPAQAQILLPWPLDHSVKLEVNKNADVKNLVIAHFDDIIDVRHPFQCLRQYIDAFYRPLSLTAQRQASARDIQPCCIEKSF
jgi:hypothetical protein